MAKVSFQTPERRTEPNGEVIYICNCTSPGYMLPHDLEWTKEKGLIPQLTIQKQILQLRNDVLNYMVTDKTLFKNPPTLSSLQGITPNWGIHIRANNELEWSQTNKWVYDLDELKKHNSIVRMVLVGLEISRSRITPVWNLEVQQNLPEVNQNIIDFDFSEPAEDAKSVASVSSDDIGIAEDEQVFQLHNPNERKKQMKAHVRELLRKVAEARHAADDAMDRFLDEYDLSENESEFSDAEEESD
jgi:hypothetical protein